MIKDVKNFEEAGNLSSLDLGEVLDTSTTIQGMMRNYSLRQHNVDNHLAGIVRHPAVILLKEELDQESSYDSEIYGEVEKGLKLVSCKVRDPSIHGMLPLPEECGPAAKDKNKSIIDIYPSYTIDPDNIVSHGDYVYVSYRNSEEYSGGHIESNIDGTGLTSNNGANYDPSSGDKTDTAESNNFSIPFIGKGKNILLIGDSHTVGTFGRTLHGLINETNTCNTVAMGGWQASSFIEMLDKKNPNPDPYSGALKMNVNLTVSSEKAAVGVMKAAYDVALVALGTNSVVSHDGAKNAYIRQNDRHIILMNKLKSYGTKVCIFIGPPAIPGGANGLNVANNLKNKFYSLTRKENGKVVKYIDAELYRTKSLELGENGVQSGYLTFISDLKKKCTSNGYGFVSSYPYTSFAESDMNRYDVHFTNEGQKWATGIWNDIQKLFSK